MRHVRPCLLAATVLLSACAGPSSRVAREAYWEKVLMREVPAGTPRALAEQRLGAHGLVVRYRPYAELGERPDECPAHRLYAQHYGALAGLAPRFDVRLILCLGVDGRVVRSYVDRFNSVI